MAGSPSDAHELLEHGEALRRLARALVRDVDEAEDVVQATWLRALQDRARRGERRLASPRGWLARILRNEVAERRRSSRRETARLARTPVAQASPPADETLARLTMRRELLDAVQSLDPPHREVVCLRWLDALPPRAIAHRLGLSPAAVESRLRRGMERLRESLDRLPGGRARWLPAVLLLTHPTLEGVPTAPDPGAPATLPAGATTLGAALGGLLMMKSKTALVAGLAVALTASLAWLALRETPRTADAGPLATGSNPAARQADVADLGAPVDRQAVATDAGPAEVLDDAGRADTLAGLVVDLDGRPLPGHALRFDGFVEAHPDDATLRAVSGPDGRFTFPRPKGIGGVVSAEDGYATVFAGEPPLQNEGRTTVVVAPARALAGQTVRGELPAVDVVLRVELPRDLAARLAVPLDHSSPRAWRTLSEADGAFRFPPTPALAGCRLLVGPHDPLALGANPRIELESFDQLDLRIELAGDDPAPRTWRGRVVDDVGHGLADADVAVDRAVTQTDADGRFTFRATADPERVLAAAPGWLPVERARDDYGGAWPDELLLQVTARPKTIRGRVLRADGQPSAQAFVWIDDPTLFADDGGVNLSVEQRIDPERRGRLGWVRVPTDAEGRFELTHLTDRTYMVKAVDRQTAEVASAQVVAGTTDAVLRFGTEPRRPTVTGRVVDRDGVGLEGVEVRASRQVFVYGKPGTLQIPGTQSGARTTTDAEGRFRLEDVPPTGVTLEISHPDVVGGDRSLADGTQDTHFELQVARYRPLRIELTAGSPLRSADQVRFVDDAGKRLRPRRADPVGDGAQTSLDLAPLTDGRSDALSVFETASTAVFLADGSEVGRLPISWSRDRITLLR